MKPPKLKIFKHLDCLTTRSIQLAVLLASLFICQSAGAQNLQPEPVARVIPGPAANAKYSRPRRVNPEENSPALSLALESVTAIERRAFEQTNLARMEKGLAPLVWDADLYRMAKVHSEQMARARFFSHETPDGRQLKDRARAVGIRFRVIGENIAYNKGYDDPGGFAVERWMISSGHRANILYVGFQASAIGSYVSADGSTYLTQVFITR